MGGWGEGMGVWVCGLDVYVRMSYPPSQHTHLSHVQELLPRHHSLLPLLGVHWFRGILHDGLQVGQTITNLRYRKVQT